MIFAIAMGILTDVRVHQPRLVLNHLGVALFQLHFSRLGGLHFRAGQNHSGLISFKQMVGVGRVTVVAQNFDARLSFCHSTFCIQREQTALRQ